jgi:hypothetical protein
MNAPVKPVAGAFEKTKGWLDWYDGTRKVDEVGPQIIILLGGDRHWRLKAVPDPEFVPRRGRVIFRRRHPPGRFEPADDIV